MARASSNLFLRLVVAEGAGILLNEIILVPNRHDTVESVILLHLQKIGKSKHLIETITVEPSATDINDVRDQMLVDKMLKYKKRILVKTNLSLKSYALATEASN